MTEHTSGISRRTIAKGAAWAVPALTLTTAPLVAASGEVWIEASSSACKLPGASCSQEVGVTKGYALTVLVCSSVESDVTIHFDPATVTVNGTPSAGWVIKPDPLVIPNVNIGANDCKTIVLGLQGNPNSQNVAISGGISFSWTSADNHSGTGNFSFSADSTPPCVNCAPA